MNKRPISGDLKLGILGGGQLGKMLIQSASRWDVYCAVLDPTEGCPASTLANEVQVGSFNEYDDVLKFGEDKDILTIEIENVNTEALITLREMGKKVFPAPEIIDLIKDKGAQKQFYKDRNIPTSDFFIVENKEELILKIKKGELDYPFVQKLCREGYDGRGVAVINSKDDSSKILEGRSVIEKKVILEKELSVILSRNEKGEINVFPTVEMDFDPEANLVDMLVSPADISEELSCQAQELGRMVVESYQLVGVLAVEMFLDKEGKLLVNEVAPRPHNSGHHTIEANYSSQYEQHLRAILGLPLGSNEKTSNAVMINLLGAEGFKGKVKYIGLDSLWSCEGAYLHVYGKKETKPFRKMGHVTICGNDIQKLIESGNELKKQIKVEAVQS